MFTTRCPAYQKAFSKYLRYGTPIERSLKAETHQTTHYIWHTAGDDKVRPSHAANEGRVFAWNNPPPTGNPGDEPGCRCTAEPYYGFTDKPIEPVYPEFALIPLLRVGRLATAWRAWARQDSASRNWQPNRNKTPETWRNQIEKGDWTPDKISNTIKNGIAYAVKNERTGGPATRYQKGNDFVVRDDKTGDILQVSRPGFKPKIF